MTGAGRCLDEGTALLEKMIHGYRAMDRWSDDRGANLLDSGAPFYDVYRTADGQYMAVGSIEPEFYTALVAGLEIDTTDFPRQHDRTAWPLMKARFADIFADRTRAHWEQVFDRRDACVTPVLSPDEAAAHPHVRARGMFARPDDVLQPMLRRCQT